MSKFGYPNPEKDLKALWNSSDEKMTLNALENLISTNEVTDFDPVREAFKVTSVYLYFHTKLMDKDGNGYISTSDLQSHMQIYFPNFRLTPEDTESMLKALGGKQTKLSLT